MDTIKTSSGQFTGCLAQLLEQADKSAARAAMANLRRGLGKPPGAAHEMDRYVLEKLPPDASSNQERAYYLVASLFAFWHQGKEKTESFDGNFGKSLKALVDTEKDAGRRDSLKKSTEKRLNAILNASSEDLPEYLRHIIGLLKAKDIPVNWSQLLYEMQYWDSESRFVQHAWAKGFWVTERENQKTIAEKELQNPTNEGEE